MGGLTARFWPWPVRPRRRLAPAPAEVRTVGKVLRHECVRAEGVAPDHDVRPRTGREVDDGDRPRGGRDVDPVFPEQVELAVTRQRQLEHFVDRGRDDLPPDQLVGPNRDGGLVEP